MAQQKYLKTYLVNQVPLRASKSLVQAEAMRMIVENNNSLNHLLEDAGQLNQVLSKIEESERTNP